MGWVRSLESVVVYINISLQMAPLDCRSSAEWLKFDKKWTLSIPSLLFDESILSSPEVVSASFIQLLWEMQW